MIDKNKILTRTNRLRDSGGANVPFLKSFMGGFGGNAGKIYESVEDTDLEFENVKEFEFEGFSVIVEDGVYAVKYEDSEDGLVIQSLIEENEKVPIFPYLFDVDGVEKVLTEEDYLRIKAFIEKEK